MIIRNYAGRLVFFDKDKYSNETQLYSALWKILYNKDFAKNSNANVRKELIEFLQ